MFVNVYCFKKIVANRCLRRLRRLRSRFRSRFRFRFRLYCSNKSKITANQMCHFLIDGAKLRQRFIPDNR